jgi:putative PIN family toxin of toxin-antitoxin system
LRAVLDPNVIISALLSPAGSPAKVLTAGFRGEFEIVVSPQLLAELERALGYPKLRTRITAHETLELLEVLRREAVTIDDPDNPPPVRSPDPGDDYLIALAAAAGAAIVSGDEHLLGLADRVPVSSPSSFLRLLESEH